MEGKENKLMTKERICLWYKDWSSTVKFIHSFFIFIITFVICISDLYSLYVEKNKTLWFVDFSSI